MAGKTRPIAGGDGPSDSHDVQDDARAPRAEAMASSVAATARRRGFTGADVVRIGRALDVAMAKRVLLIADDHDPAYLHPGRTALVLLHDVADVSPRAVVFGALLESRDRQYEPDAARVPEVIDPSDLEPWTALTEAMGRGLPIEDLAADLVVLEPVLLVAVLAERLDHLRHEHLRPPRTSWAALVDEAERLWGPLADRVAPTLSRRYRHWIRTFRRRLPPAGGEAEAPR